MKTQTEALLRLVEKQGHNWQSIVTNHFPGRTALSARNQYIYMWRRSGLRSQPPTPSSNQSSLSPQPGDRSSLRSKKNGASPRTPASREPELESGIGDPDFDNYSLSDDDEGDDWPLNYTTLQHGYANSDSHTASQGVGLGPQMTPFMDMDPLSPTVTLEGTSQYPSLDELFPGHRALGDTQMYMQTPPSEGATVVNRNPNSPWENFANGN